MPKPIQSNNDNSDQPDIIDLPDLASGVEAYIYGYPLVVLAMTERVATTAADTTTTIGRAPINQFAKGTKLPNGSYKDVVLPSTTTLYASAFLNLSAEPVVLHIPEILPIPGVGKRFFIFQILNAWTNVSRDSPSRRLDSPPGDYALVGPDWKEPLRPKIANIIRLQTNTMWIIGRIYTTGTVADLRIVVDKIFPKITLTPLSAFGKNYTPPANLPINPSIDTSTTPVEQVANMDACAFFGTMAAMMTSNAPLKYDQPTVDRLAKLHVIPGNQFDCGAWACEDPELRATLQLAVAAAKRVLNGAPPPSLTPTNWSMPLDVGDYGRRYLLRALVAKNALGANRAEDAVYGYTTHDSAGAAKENVLTGANRYVLHFDAPTHKMKAGELPPVHRNGFWSLTMYNSDGTLVDNKIVDYNAIGGFEVQAHKATFNSDGSLDIYIQEHRPSDPKEFSNWLPAPRGEFILFLRMYWPGDAVTGGNWYPPGVQKVNSSEVA